MPFRSVAQSRWAFTPAGKRALGGADKVKEWADSTNYGGLPERSDVGKKDWIKGAVRHPGALSRAAAQHGVSKLQEADKESHSPDPGIRARGALGKRFIRKSI